MKIVVQTNQYKLRHAKLLLIFFQKNNFFLENCILHKKNVSLHFGNKSISNYLKSKEMKSKLLRLAAVSMILMTVLGACDKDESGKTGNIKWKLDKEGTLTIRGKGAMPENNLSWYLIEDKINALVIEEGITDISPWAFCLPNLTSVTIANTVTNIGEGAFCGCPRLRSISIPNSVKTIGNSVFASCISLNSVTIGNSVTSIGDETFSNCQSLNSINIPNNVITIGGKIFFNCSQLTSITIGNNVTNIGKRAFLSCTNLISVTIPNKVITIEEETFANCRNLTTVILPNSVTRIVGSTFRSCENLTSITCFNPVPADIDLWTFRDINKSACTLKVPTSAISAYQNAYEWKDFNIVGL